LLKTGIRSLAADFREEVERSALRWQGDKPFTGLRPEEPLAEAANLR
jgi:hypothetical protein